MAKLYCDIETNRTHRRGSEIHRLGDSYVIAHVQNWEHSAELHLTDEGVLTVSIVCLGTPNHVVLYEGSIAEVLHPKPVAVSQPAEVTALEVDVQQFLKESA